MRVVFRPPNGGGRTTSFAQARRFKTADDVRPASAPASSARAVCRASWTVSVSGAPNVRLAAEPLQRRCTIRRLRPFRRRGPRPRRRTAPQHGLLSVLRREVAPAPAILVFVLSVIVRSLPFVSEATGAARVAHRRETPGTRWLTRPGSMFERVGNAALKRRAGCTPLQPWGLRRFADAWGDCDSLRQPTSSFHTPDTATAPRQLPCRPPRFPRTKGKTSQRPKNLRLPTPCFV